MPKEAPGRMMILLWSLFGRVLPIPTSDFDMSVARADALKLKTRARRIYWRVLFIGGRVDFDSMLQLAKNRYRCRSRIRSKGPAFRLGVDRFPLTLSAA
jgi:hypothetical protein